MRRKTILLFLFFIAFIPFVNTQNKPKTASNPKVEVYYFHPTERCPIDQAIEENTRATMQASFAKEVKEGTIKFQVLNTDDKVNAKTAAKFDFNAQALYIVKLEKGKEIKNDLTEFAFSCGLSNPSKFKTRLKEEIENALK
jgi:hypothetical protein